MRDPDWLIDAACRGMDPELFYATETQRNAQAICNRCPVIAICWQTISGIEAGIGYQGATHGVWAGLTAAQRIELYRQRRAKQRGLNDDAARMRALGTIYRQTGSDD